LSVAQKVSTDLRNKYDGVAATEPTTIPSHIDKYGLMHILSLHEVAAERLTINVSRSLPADDVRIICTGAFRFPTAVDRRQPHPT
jgi:hypothetical protein